MSGLNWLTFYWDLTYSIIYFQYKKKGNWKKWTDEELAAVKKAFHQNIKHSVHPTRALIAKAKENFPVLHGRSAIQIASQVKNMTKKTLKWWSISTRSWYVSTWHWYMSNPVKRCPTGCQLILTDIFELPTFDWESINTVTMGKKWAIILKVFSFIVPLCTCRDICI